MEMVRVLRFSLNNMNADPDVFIAVYYFGMLWMGVLRLCDLAIARAWKRFKNRKARKGR